MRSRVVTLFFFVFALSPSNSDAGLLGDIWDGVKSVVSAPVRGAGWLLGQGVDAAVDPALDNAFGRLRETTDHAIDRIDSMSAARIGQLDQVAQERIKQLDEVAKARIAQVDTLLEKRLDQADHILDDKLNRIEEIGTLILDREAQILDENLTRVEDILDRSLDRLQDLETNAFDRVDAALQDQVPFAASQVARTMEWTAAIIVFIVVLVGFGGAQLLQRLRTDTSNKPIWAKLATNLTYVPRTVLLVGVPMLFLFGIVQTGYIFYCNRADAARIARVEDAADLLERAGDFRAATNFRKRAFALNGDDRRHYMVMRDQLIADFWQRHIGQDVVEVIQRLNHLRTDPAFTPFADSDTELRAAAIYIRACYTENADAQDIVADIAKYKTLLGVTRGNKPVLGKLVYMSESKVILNDAQRAIDDRLKAASTVVDELLTIDEYKKYAPGLVLRSQLAVHQLELDADQPGSTVDAATIEARSKAIQSDVEAAFAADQNLARYIRFRAKSLPKDLADNLYRWSEARTVEARAALENGSKEKLSAVIPRQLDEYASELDRIVKPLLGVDVLSRAKVERQLLHSMRSMLGEKKLKEQIDTARKSKRDGKGALELFSAYKSVADTASQIGKLQIAEAWLNETLSLIDSSPDAFVKNEGDLVKKDLADCRKTAGHPAPDGNAPLLTDVMFYVF